MQEEVEQKTIALSVRTARMTSIVPQQALRKFLDAQKHKTHKLPHGKQTLKDLMKQNTGISSLEVNYDNIKDFENTQTREIFKFPKIAFILNLGNRDDILISEVMS